MSGILISIVWLLAVNLWVGFGCVVLARALNRSVVEHPAGLLQAILWMCVWPLLLLRTLRQLSRVAIVAEDAALDTAAQPLDRLAR